MSYILILLKCLYIYIKILIILYLPFLFIAFIFVIWQFIYRWYYNDTSPIKIEPVKYKPNLWYSCYIFLILRPVNMYIIIIYNFLNYYINNVKSANLIINILYVIFVLLTGISKRFIDFSLIIIKVIFETQIPRYYKFIYLIYQYSSYYNKFYDCRIFIKNKKIYLNGNRLTDKLVGMFYLKDYKKFERGKHLYIDKNGFIRFHPAIYDTKNKVYFTITHTEFNDKKEDNKNNLLCNDKRGRKMYIYFNHITDKNNFIKTNEYNITDLSNLYINHYFCNYIRVNKEILARRDSIIALKSTNREKIIVRYVYDKQLLNLFNSYWGEIIVVI